MGTGFPGNHGGACFGIGASCPVASTDEGEALSEITFASEIEWLFLEQLRGVFPVTGIRPMNGVSI